MAARPALWRKKPAGRAQVFQPDPDRRCAAYRARLAHGHEPQLEDVSRAEAVAEGHYREVMDLSDGLVRRARERGVVFAIDTDAHAVPHLDYIRYGVAVAQRGWLSADEVINTLPLDQLGGFLAKGRS